MFAIIQLSHITPGLIMTAQILLSLAILIILHEGGHFFAARFFGIKVEKFYLFFDAWGIKLFHFKKGDTEYGIGWLPLGGYVKIAGMIDESMDKEQMALPPKPDEFRSKPAWQRLIVMVGGVTVNLILGIFILFILNLTTGQQYIPISEFKDGIVPGKSLSKIGLKVGDKIIKIGNKIVEKESDLMSSDLLYGNVDLLLERDHRNILVHVPGNFSQYLDDSKDMEPLITPRIRTVVDSVLPNSGAFKAGLIKQDLVVGVEQTKVSFIDELNSYLKNYKNKMVKVFVIRNNNPMVMSMQVDSAGKMGFRPDLSFLKVKTEHYGVFSAFSRSIPTAFRFIGDQAKAIGKIAKGEIKTKQLSGPIGIAQVFGGNFDWYRFWRLTAMLSMILAFMNLLPIPALDGGHVLFLLIEIVKGKPLSEKFLEVAQIVGFFLLVGVMTFVFGNDIIHKVLHL